MPIPSPSLRLRIAVVQFNPKSSSPKIGQVQTNVARARELCHKLKPRSVDLVCFPEMAFTGYVFENSSAILPYLEEPRIGLTSSFCSELAKRLECYVVAGYPERLEPGEVETTTEDAAAGSEIKVGANSAVFYGPNGEWAGGYRKTNLFETDMTWAIPGSGFTTFDMPSPLRTTSLGICMDLNPQPPTLWTLAEGPYELADHCISKKTNVLIMLNSWLDSDTEPEEKHDWHTLNYWAARLRPLWVNEATDEDNADEYGVSEAPSDAPDSGDETIVIICNRSGEENGKTFAGSSALFSMRRNSGRPKLLDMMERREEGVRIWDLLV